MSGGRRQKERQKYHHGIDTTDKIELGARNIYRLNAAGAFCLEASRDMSIKGRLAHFHFGGDHWIMTNVRMLISYAQTDRPIDQMACWCGCCEEFIVERASLETRESCVYNEIMLTNNQLQ